MSNKEKRVRTAFAGVPRRKPEPEEKKEKKKSSGSGMGGKTAVPGAKVGGRGPRTVVIGTHGYRRDE